MDLSNLKPAKGSTKNRKRIARGQGSGAGGTATRGHRLLKKKRDGLIMDFFKLLENAKDLRGEMIENYKEGVKSLRRTRILSQDMELKIYAKTQKNRNLIDFQTKNIMGR